MDTRAAVKHRSSVRAFKPDKVPQEVLREILGLALQAPSWGNIQPWEVAVVSGKALRDIEDGAAEKAEQRPAPDIASPFEFPDLYARRRDARITKYMAVKGIQRADREGRGWWRMQGLRHFGAPAVIYICTDRSFFHQAGGINPWPLFDCGLAAENIMLLAADCGLGTVVQAQAVAYPDVLRRVLGTPESKLFVLGISIGYPNWDDPINQCLAEREPLENVVTWH